MKSVLLSLITFLFIFDSTKESIFLNSNEQDSHHVKFRKMKQFRYYENPDQPTLITEAVESYDTLGNLVKNIATFYDDFDTSTFTTHYYYKNGKKISHEGYDRKGNLNSKAKYSWHGETFDCQVEYGGSRQVDTYNKKIEDYFISESIYFDTYFDEDNNKIKDTLFINITKTLITKSKDSSVFIEISPLNGTSDTLVSKTICKDSRGNTTKSVTYNNLGKPILLYLYSYEYYSE